MDSKMTLTYGIVALLVGVLLCYLFRAQVAVVFWGAIALVALLVGLLLVGMGYVQVKEDRATAAKDQQEAQVRESMAVHTES